MVNERRLQSHWNQIKTRLRNKWCQLTHDDLERFDGNVDRLVCLIERKTGEGRETVEEVLSDFADHSSTTIAGATEDIYSDVEHAGEKIQPAESVREDYETICQGHDDVEELVRRCPSETAVVCFAVGLLTGLTTAFVLYRK